MDILTRKVGIANVISACFRPKLGWSWKFIFLFREIRNKWKSEFNFAKSCRNFVTEISRNFVKISFILFRELSSQKFHKISPKFLSFTSAKFCGTVFVQNFINWREVYLFKAAPYLKFSLSFITSLKDMHLSVFLKRFLNLKAFKYI
jgi:hypothetical protein